MNHLFVHLISEIKWNVTYFCMDQHVDLVEYSMHLQCLSFSHIEYPNCWMSRTLYSDLFQPCKHLSYTIDQPNCVDVVYWGESEKNKEIMNKLSYEIYVIKTHRYRPWSSSFVTHDTTTTARPTYPSILMLGYVLFVGVLFSPGIEPADRPSHS